MTGRRGRALAGYLALAAATLACAGCPGSLEDPGRFVLALDDAGNVGMTGSDAANVATTGSDAGTDGGDCTEIPRMFGASCTSSSCHSASNKAQGLDLESPDLAARLVNVPATEGAGLLIDPATPSESVLYLKLMPNPPFGARMPLGETPLSATATACVLAWIGEAARSVESDGGPAAGSADTEGGDETSSADTDSGAVDDGGGE